MTNRRMISVAGCGLIFLYAAAQLPPGRTDHPQALYAQGSTSPSFGDPLTGLLPVEFERFRLGLDDFLEVETPEDGLGPSFNATSCAVCHNVPAVGGISLVSEVRAAYRDETGRIRPLTGYDGRPLDTLFHL